MRTTVLAAHILGGGIGLASGFLALYAPKGATLHRWAGLLFVYAMLLMCAGGLLLSVGGGPWAIVNSSAAALSALLILTALTTLRAPSAWTRWVDRAALPLSLAIGLVNLALAIEAIASGGRRNGVPAFPHLMFGVVGLLAAAGDVRVLRSGPRKGAFRIARHLWRMSFALLIAAMSFFFGQAQVIPEPIRIRPLLALPVVAVIVTMFYWLWRVRLRRSLRGLAGVQPIEAA